MGFSKVIPIGNMGQLEISENAGIATLKVGVIQSVGGGSVAGIAKASANVEVDVSAVMLIDAGLELAAAKFPAAAAIIAGAKAAIDAELAKA